MERTGIGICPSGTTTTTKTATVLPQGATLTSPIVGGDSTCVMCGIRYICAAGYSKDFICLTSLPVGRLRLGSKSYSAHKTLYVYVCINRSLVGGLANTLTQQPCVTLLLDSLPPSRTVCVCKLDRRSLEGARVPDIHGHRTSLDSRVAPRAARGLVMRKIKSLVERREKDNVCFNKSRPFFEPLVSP